MPFKQKIRVDENTDLILWHITESANDLSLLSVNIADEQTPRSKNNLHWMASRAIICSYFNDSPHIVLYKDEFNKPHLEVGSQKYFISISHSFTFAAVIISKVRNCAVDIEKIDSRVQRVSSKFLHHSELESMQGNESPILAATLIWSAKETIYKWYGKKEVDFKNEMQITLPSSLIQSIPLGGILHKNGVHQFNIFWLMFDEYIITWI